MTTVLHDSTGTGNGSIDWNFSIPDKDLDYLSAGQTLTVDYNVKVSDASTSSTQTVELTITGSNDPVLGANEGDAGWLDVPTAKGTIRLRGVPRLVRTRGGAYTFLPSISALRWIGSQGS